MRFVVGVFNKGVPGVQLGDAHVAGGHGGGARFSLLPARGSGSLLGFGEEKHPSALTLIGCCRGKDTGEFVIAMLSEHAPRSLLFVTSRSAGRRGGVAGERIS